MNSFVCEPDFYAAARKLDPRRLGKQRIECWQMLLALQGMSKGWSKHPATQAWKGHEYSLAQFALACHDEWIWRGYKDTTMDRVIEELKWLTPSNDPWWITDETWLRSIRGKLIFKDPDYYGPLWPDVEPIAGRQRWPVADQPGVFR